MANPFIPKAPKPLQTSELNKSAGILDDFAIRKNVATLGGTIEKVPVNDNDIANKKYVDDNSGGAPEGTAVKSTGEAGGTKFLREDGDGTCSWQAASVSSMSGISDTKANFDTACSDGNFAFSGGAFHDGFSDFVANEHIDWTSDQGATNIHSGNIPDLSATYLAVAGTDIIKDTHIDWGTGASQVSADDIPDGATNAIITLTQETNFETAYTHSQDNTQAHSDYLLNSGADEAVGPLTITADNSTADQAYVPMVLYNTDATPPAASGFPVGTIYIQYTP